MILWCKASNLGCFVSKSCVLPLSYGKSLIISFDTNYSEPFKWGKSQSRMMHQEKKVWVLLFLLNCGIFYWPLINLYYRSNMSLVFLKLCRLYWNRRKITTMPGYLLVWQLLSWNSLTKPKVPTKRLLSWNQGSCWHGRYGWDSSHFSYYMLEHKKWNVYILQKHAIFGSDRKSNIQQSSAWFGPSQSKWIFLQLWCPNSLQG